MSREPLALLGQFPPQTLHVGERRHVCQGKRVCLQTPGRALRQTQSQVGAAIASRPPCLWGSLISVPACLPPGLSPASFRLRAAYLMLAPPGLWHYHSCPLSWLCRTARFPHPGNVVGNFEWPPPACPPPSDASFVVGAREGIWETQWAPLGPSVAPPGAAS